MARAVEQMRQYASGGPKSSLLVPLLALAIRMGERAHAGPADEPAMQPSAAPVEPVQPNPQPAWFNVHGQATVISQKHDVFPAPYAGRNSLPRDEPFRTSVTGTLFLGARLPWEGGEVYFDPEIAGGEGFGGVTGIAGFPNGEIPRVASPDPEPYVARLYFRQTFGFWGATERVEDTQNQLPGMRGVSRLTVNLGKFSAVDFFQQSAYANDPRAQFENWDLFTDAAWDYPADVRGYTEGAVIDFNQANWALRYGAMAEPKTANGGTLDSRVWNALGQSIELEQRWAIAQHPGDVRLMGYLNSAHAGKYRDAIDHPGPRGPDVTLTRTFRSKYGFGLTADKEVTHDLGIFSRLGWNDGHSESWAFTEVDRSFSVGMSLKGSRWHRPDDVAGLSVAINGLAHDHREHLGSGGYGFIIGDGKLPHYALEDIVEAYYLFKVVEHVFVTPDIQFIDHPAYNSDRGPVVVGGIRVHIEF
jgi:high affinity Mn2+ porin